MTNQRSSFRIDEELDAELHFRSRVFPCRIVNLSAGGARIQSGQDLPRDRTCMLQVPLKDDLADAVGAPTMKMHLEILDSTPNEEGFVTRLRSLDGPGSPEHEAMAKLVFAIQRRARAAQSGVDDASPMQSTADSIRRERTRTKLRISRSLWRPSNKRPRDD